MNGFIGKSIPTLFVTKSTGMNESDPRSDVHYLGSSENKALRGSLSFMSLSAVQIYDFHIFLTVYSSLHGFI